MSFSGDVKEELAQRMPNARHCQLAELAALLHYSGQLGQDEDGHILIGFQTDRESVVRKGFTLLKKTYNIGNACGLEQREASEFLEKMGDISCPVNPILYRSTCCQRAFLRGAFLGCGSVSDPQKGYHLEFVCDSEEKAEQLRELATGFEIETKMILRKKYYVVYLKEGESISLLLNVMEAPKALMELENTRIYKEVCNTVNRRVNCELSNIRKTVTASGRQVEDIRYIRDHYGLDKLPESLQQMALIRLEYPDTPLADLGTYLDPPVGKSGVNHRLRRLSEFARQLQEDESALNQR